jgi:hypothetical protein
MNLKLEGQRDNVSYAINLAIGTLIVQPSALALQEGGSEVEGDVTGGEETRRRGATLELICNFTEQRICNKYGTTLQFQM